MSSGNGAHGNLIKSWSNFITGFLSLPVIGILAYATTTFPVVDWAPLGLAFWPRVLLALWCAFSLVLIFQGFRGPNGGDTLDLRAFVPLAIGIGFLLLVPILGMLASLWLMCAIFSFLRRSVRNKRSLATSLIAATFITLTIYLLFDVALGVQLPQPMFGG